MRVRARARAIPGTHSVATALIQFRVNDQRIVVDVYE